MPCFSTPLPDDLVTKSGSLTRFPTAIHKNNQVCIEAAERARHEFNEAMDTEIMPMTVADIPSLGRMHAIAFTIPNCLPERLAVLARFAEFTLLNHDFCDVANNEEIGLVSNNIQSVLSGEAGSGSTKTLTNPTKSKQFQSSILLDMMRVDGELAMDIMDTYSKGFELATFPPDTLKTLDEYLPVRMINSRLDVFQTMSCFGMGLKLPCQEKEQLSELIDTAMFSTTLINDYYSWPKEIKHHIETPGSGHPFNAVAILMRHGGCSEEEAMQKLREKQISLQDQHLGLLRKLESEGKVPEKHMMYILAAQHTASGSEFWGIHGPRYPSKECLNQPTVEFVDGGFRYKPEPVVVEVKPTACKPNVTLAKTGCSALNCHSLKRKNANPSVGESLPKGQLEANGAHKKRVKSSCAASEGSIHCSDDVVRAPFNYLASLPSKGIRDIFIAALNWWLAVPEGSLASIKAIVGMLHQSSLMLGDIDGDSKLRRGSPCTHMIYGKGQTINSANYIFVQAFAELQKLKSPEATEIFLEELENLHCGQSLDLFWKHHVHCPSVEQYLMMVDNKTGGLFRLCVRLMEAESTREFSGIDSTRFVTQLSRYFQIRDDYQNLVSNQYAKEKRFAEDLDEGKISLPLIYCLQAPECARSEIMGIFKHRQSDTLPVEVKQFIIAQMKRVGALDSTYALLREMQMDLLQELRRLEQEFGQDNPTLELVLRKLWV